MVENADDDVITQQPDKAPVNPSHVHKYKVTNKTSGPKGLNSPNGGQVLAPVGKTVVIELTEAEVSDYQKAFKAIEFEQTDDEVTQTQNVGGIAPDKASEPPQDAMPKAEETAAHEAQLKRTDEGQAIPEKAPDADKETPDRVVHRGGGRYYGMAGDDAITDPMTKDEATKYAADHELTLG